MTMDFGFKFNIGDFVRLIGISTRSDPISSALGQREYRMRITARRLFQNADGVTRSYLARALDRSGCAVTKLVEFDEMELVASAPFSADAK